MSTISSTADRHPDAGGSALATAVAVLERAWRAYVRWRLEQTAIILLGSMSDRELLDIGLSRSEIASAVKGERAGAMAKWGGPADGQRFCMDLPQLGTFGGREAG